MWVWVGFSPIFAFLIVFLFLQVRSDCRDSRVEREFEGKLEAREPMSDEEMVSRFFEVGEVLPIVPGPVRRVFASHFDYPADKLLPDDDISVSWICRECDMADFVEELEAEFGVTLAPGQFEWLPFSIRGMSRQVTNLLHRKSSGT
jgi:hypothetical protein